jgi:pimeloyl-ACP methyl ester carboxylesterase
VGGVTAVFVHGNPETAAVWRPLLAELDRDDVVTLSPPGFGAPLPAGFTGSCDEHLAWLVSELEALGEPVDLVGHDWGAMHSLRVACERPDLLRSWCVDTASWAPDYEWHEVTRRFQAPGAGEQLIQAWLAMGATGRRVIFQPAGVAPDVVAELAAAIDEEMGRAILGVYRSGDAAAFARWRTGLPAAAARPGLILAAVGDDFGGTEADYRWVASEAGASVEVLHGLGHWWMLEDPVAGAQALQSFWKGLPST